MTVPLWKLDRVTQRGSGSRLRLDDINVEIQSGVTAVIGPSGAGKTSLLNLLVGFESPDSGKVSRTIPVDENRLPLFWVPPDDGLWPHLTISEHLQAVDPFGPANVARIPHDVETANSLLADFDLQDKNGARPDQLSQGERARLAVVRALASQAAVLVMDEPLTHVDPLRVTHYWRVIRERLAGRIGTSIIFSTHSPEIALREAEWVLCINHGKLNYYGSVSELYVNPPTPELAWMLGPANWFELKQHAQWMTNGSSPRRCYRPEQIRLEITSQSPLVVKSSEFCGSVAEVELVNEAIGESRRFYHRPAVNNLRPGDRVLVHICLMLLLCLSLVGCGSSEAGQLMPVRDVEYWSIPAEGSRVPAPRAVHATEKGDIYVLDNVGRVLVFDESGHVQRQWWMPEYSVGKPEKICLLKDGRLAVADTHYHRVIFFDGEGKLAGMHGSFGRDQEQFIYPVAIAQDDEENYYICEYGSNDRVQKFTREGKYLLQFGSFGTEKGQFQRPSGIAWHNDRLYVVDAFNNRIQVFSEQGDLLDVLGSSEGSEGLYYPYDIAINSGGEIFIVEYGGGRVSKFDLTGKLLGRFGSTGTGESQFNTPWGICVDIKSRIYVADTGNRRIVQLRL